MTTEGKIEKLESMSSKKMLFIAMVAVLFGLMFHDADEVPVATPPPAEEKFSWNTMERDLHRARSWNDLSTYSQAMLLTIGSSKADFNAALRKNTRDVLVAAISLQVREYADEL